LTGYEPGCHKIIAGDTSLSPWLYHLISHIRLISLSPTTPALAVVVVGAHDLLLMVFDPGISGRQIREGVFPCRFSQRL
jgi:hypothetical protein